MKSLGPKFRKTHFFPRNYRKKKIKKERIDEKRAKLKNQLEGKCPNKTNSKNDDVVVGQS